jgi:hypothetical protein
VKPNLAILARISQAITRQAIHYPGLRLTTQGGTSVDGNRLKYWQRTETAVQGGGPVHSLVSEHTFSIHLTPSLELILRRVKTLGALKVVEIQEALTAELGATREEASEYIRLLVDSGLLVVAGLRQSIFDPLCWSHFADELDRMQDPSLTEIAQALHRIEQLAKDFETADVLSRPMLLESVEAAAAGLLETAGSSGPVPRPVLYEDSRASVRTLWINRTDWEEPLSDLAELQCLFALFDPLLVSKISLKSLFKRRYGPGGTCRDLLDFSDFFHEVFYRPYLQATADAAKRADYYNPFGHGILNPLKLPEIAAIINARIDLSSKLNNALTDAGDAEEFLFPQEWVHCAGADMLRRHRVLSNSFFFQAAKIDGELLLALNHVYGGFGCMFTRFTHLFAETSPHSLEEMLRTNVAGMEEPGTLFAEIQGGHETNLNQHRLLANAELIFPGERGAAPLERQIHLSELTLRHDPHSDEVSLYCDRLAKQIVPLYLGMLYPLALPELQTLLLHFSPPTVLRSDLAPKDLPAGDAVLYRPRVRYKHVVIERAKWVARIASLPARKNRERDYEYLLRLSRWREAAGIPTEVFARLGAVGVSSSSGGDDATHGQDALLHGTPPSKPFYVDFDRPFSVFLLEKSLADNNGFVHFSEMLPASNNAIVSHQGDAIVSEFVVEITHGSPL